MRRVVGLCALFRDGVRQAHNKTQEERCANMSGGFRSDQIGKISFCPVFGIANLLQWYCQKPFWFWLHLSRAHEGHDKERRGAERESALHDPPDAGRRREPPQPHLPGGADRACPIQIGTVSECPPGADFYPVTPFSHGSICKQDKEVVRLAPGNPEKHRPAAPCGDRRIYQDFSRLTESLSRYRHLRVVGMVSVYHALYQVHCLPKLVTISCLSL